MAVKTMNKLFDAKAYERGERQSDDAYDVTYEGAVLALYENNGYNDSDFCAVVWDGEQLRSTQYATTRGWTYPNGAKVDATDEVKDLARDYVEREALKRMRGAADDDAKKVKVGKKVRVVKGRKVKVGTEGWVAFVGSPRSYGGSSWAEVSQSVALQVDGELKYTYLKNLEVLDWEQYRDSDEVVAERAKNYADGIRRDDRWYSAYMSPAYTVLAKFGKA